MKLEQLVGLNDKNVFNFIENFHNAAFICLNDSNHQALHNAIDQTTCQHELEKANLIIEQKNLILEQKDKEIAYLKDIIELVKKQG